MNNADDVTRNLWRQTFKTSFARPGSMFRGNPPYGRLHVLSETYQKALVLPREIDVQIDKIQVSTLPPDHPFPDETVLSLSLVKSYGKASKLFKKECSLKRASSTEKKDQTCEITSGTPGDPLVKFSIGKSGEYSLFLHQKSLSRHSWNFGAF